MSRLRNLYLRLCATSIFHNVLKKSVFVHFCDYVKSESTDSKLLAYSSMVTAIGSISGTTVGFIANQASKDEGRLTVYGCKKAARFVAFCDCFSIPVVTIVDSMGMKISTAPQGELARNGA